MVFGLNLSHDSYLEVYPQRAAIKGLWNDCTMCEGVCTGCVGGLERWYSHETPARPCSDLHAALCGSRWLISLLSVNVPI